jgi:hypothetical protein
MNEIQSILHLWIQTKPPLHPVERNEEAVVAIETAKAC